MSVTPIRNDFRRSAKMLRTELGAQIDSWPNDAPAVEVMLHPDRRRWVDRLRDALFDTGLTLSAAADRPTVGSTSAALHRPHELMLVGAVARSGRRQLAGLPSRARIWRAL